MCVHNYAVWCAYKFVYVYQIRNMHGPAFIQFQSDINTKQYIYTRKAYCNYSNSTYDPI